MNYLKLRKRDDSQSVTVRGGLLGLDMSAKDLTKVAGYVVYLWPILMELLPLLDEELESGAFYDGMEDDEVEYFSLGKVFKGIGKAIGKVAKGVGKVAKGVVQSGVLNVVPGFGPVAQAIGSAIIGQPSVGPSYQALPLGPAIPLVPQAPVQTMYNPGTGVYEAADPGQPPHIVATPDSRVLQCRELFKNVARQFGVKEGLKAMAAQFPDIFDLFVVMADYAKMFPDAAPALGNYPERGYVEQDAECSACSTKLGDFGGGNLPTGTFYRSNLVTASIRRDLGSNVYGEVHLGKMPFPLYIAGTSKDARARIALAHELAHVATKLYKLPLAHGQVHDLGVFFASEGLPLLQAFERI